jgi:hypothetical protein
VILVVQPPPDYDTLLGELPPDITVGRRAAGQADLIHAFFRERVELERGFPDLRALLKPDGSLWISWPKRSSGVPSDLNENLVREIGLRNGLVDVKVASVDATWSALKFVFRKAGRKGRIPPC